MTGAVLAIVDCEAVESLFGLDAQRVNAVSSLSFVVAGLAVARGPLRGWSIGLAVILVATGLGSVLFHGPRPAGSQFAHDAPIVVLAVFAIAALGVLRPPVRALVVPGALGVVALCTWWLGREDSPACDPSSVWQLHGLWHVLAAATVVLWWRAVTAGGSERRRSGRGE